MWMYGTQVTGSSATEDARPGLCEVDPVNEAHSASSTLLHLGQPECHLHVAVQRGRAREMLLGAAGPRQPVVAVRHERPHPELGGERERLPVTVLGGFDHAGRACERRLPPGPKRPALARAPPPR